MRDLYVSPETGRLAYFMAARDRRDRPRARSRQWCASGRSRVRTKDDSRTSIAGRGWLDRRRFVLMRTVRPLNEDRTSDVGDSGRGRARADHGSPAASRRCLPSRSGCMRRKRVLYMTRVGAGHGQRYAFSLDTGALTAVTQNALPGVTFSGFQPAGRTASSACAKNGAKTSGSFSRRRHRGPAIRPAADSNPRSASMAKKKKTTFSRGTDRWKADAKRCDQAWRRSAGSRSRSRSEGHRAVRHRTRRTFPEIEKILRKALVATIDDLRDRSLAGGHEDGCPEGWRPVRRRRAAGRRATSVSRATRSRCVSSRRAGRRGPRPVP